MSEAFCDDRFSDTSDDVEATVGELRREAKIRQTLPWFLSAVLHALVVLAGFWMTFLVIQSEDEPRPIAVRSDFEAMAFAPVRMPTESVNVAVCAPRAWNRRFWISLVSNLSCRLFQHLLLEHHRCSLLQ